MDPLTLSNNSSLFLDNEYKYVPNQDAQPQLTNCDVMPSLNVVFSINPGPTQVKVWNKLLRPVMRQNLPVIAHTIYYHLTLHYLSLSPSVSPP